jgi:hypothetical protein
MNDGRFQTRKRLMSLFIVRISETAGRVTRTRLPGEYGDEHAAQKAMETVLTGYTSHGRNDEHGYWWARDRDGNEFKFEISGG